MTYDAIVVGGGPAGASTGLALARRGRSVAIVEKSAFPRRKVCGEFVSAANVGVLEALDIAPAWQALAGPEVRRVGLFFGETTLSATMPRPAGGGFGRALGREVLDLVLLEAAREAGAEVFQPWRAVEIGREGRLHRVCVASGKAARVLSAPVVVAAHGSWEPGSLLSEAAKTRSDSDLFGFKARFLDADLPADLMPLLVFPGGYGGLVRTDGGRLSLSCCIRHDELMAARKMGGGLAAGEAVRRHIEQWCRGAREALAGARIETGWLGAGPIRPGIRPRYQGDVFRVGNAAGEAHPIVAEGIGMALQSGWLLATVLADLDFHDPAARAAAGRRYAAAWRAQFTARIRAAGVFAQLAIRPSSVALIGPLMRGAPGLLTLGAMLSGKTRQLSGLRERRARRPA